MMAWKQKLQKAVDRREFIKLSGTSALATCLLTSSKSISFAALPTDVDVIIIGAGIAGLTAAQKLQKLNYSVLVLEAKDHIGGRLKTDWSLGAPFEIGAGWIHGPKGNPISKLAKNVGAKTFVTDDENFSVYAANGIEQDYNQILDKQHALEKLYQTIDDTFDDDQSLSRAIKRVSPKSAKDPALRWMQSAYTEFDTGGPLESLSAYYFDEDDTFDGEDVILTTGYDEILTPLAEGLDIRLGHPVEKIEYEAGDGASVYVGGIEFEANFVICTCPLGVLQSGDIEFDPPLPKKITKSINHIGMGNVTKIALKFEQAFWPVDTQYFGLMTKEKGRWNYFLNYRTFSKQNILLGFSVGDYAQKAEQLSDQEMTADAMDAIRSMFGNRAPNPSNARMTRWSKDPFTKGAYSYAKLGSKPADFDDLAQPIAKTLIFAGEHTNFKYHATTHGAHLSGLAAADIIEDKLAD
ncbi:MAG: FAD-dependent oxidoreductase [Rhizobiales bacterium]|nr:FAD-dependent oxidoreductase [Hyphomicrobiales bacterium]